MTFPRVSAFRVTLILPQGAAMGGVGSRMPTGPLRHFDVGARRVDWGDAAKAVFALFVLSLGVLGNTGCSGGLFGFDEQSCAGVDCSGAGVCVMENGRASCVCDPGYREAGLECVSRGSHDDGDGNVDGKADSPLGTTADDPCEGGTPIFVDGQPICITPPDTLDSDRELMPQETIAYSQEVPDNYSIRDRCGPVVNQGYSPSCTAASSAGALSCHEGQGVTYSFWYLWDQYKFPNMVALSNHIDTWIPLESCYPSYGSTPSCDMDLDKAATADRVVLVGDRNHQDTSEVAVQTLAAGYVGLAACQLDSGYWSANHVITDTDFTPDGGHAIALVGYEAGGGLDPVSQLLGRRVGRRWRVWTDLPRVFQRVVRCLQDRHPEVPLRGVSSW